MFVLVFEFGDGDFGGEGMTPWEIKNPNRTRNGNDSMKTTMSQLRVFKVMLAGRDGKKTAGVNHSDVDEAGQIPLTNGREQTINLR
jgi:hypothetical protein